MTTSLITSPITARVTWNCRPRPVLDAHELAKAIRDTSWTNGGDDPLDTGASIGGDLVVLEWDDLTRESLEILSKAPAQKADEGAGG
jgi:hypothetical protein